MKKACNVLIMYIMLLTFSANSKGQTENIHKQTDLNPQQKIAFIWSDKPLARTGDTIRFSAFVENTGKTGAGNLSIVLKAPGGISVINSEQKIDFIPAGSYQRINWNLRAEKSDTAQLGLKVFLSSNEKAIDTNASYKILVIDRTAKYSRQELCTDEDGYWRLLEKPGTLQVGNSASLVPVTHLKSSEIKHNTYGICTHLPRSRDYEDPFNPSHLIDGNAESCWSSQQNPSQYPGMPPWAEIDMRQVIAVKQVNLVPYWHNTDFPNGFTIKTSLDGKKWMNLLAETNYKIVLNGEKRSDKVVQPFPIEKPVKARYIRIEFERLPLSGGNYAEVSLGYKARLSGIEVIDISGRNVALKSAGANIKVCDFFTGWQNTAKTVNESFDRLFDLGLKMVRVGQWGDQTEWAAVEREKGRYKMDAATDAGIRKLIDNGVDILYGLNYGNALYNQADTAWLDIGPIYKEGNPFYKNAGPRTDEQRKAFVNYVDFVVRKYGYGIKWWELWNEENGWYPGFEPVFYGKLLYEVGKHIKEINPELKLMYGGTAAPAPITTEISLREGAAPYVDGYAFHPYGIDKPEGGMGTMEYFEGKNLSQSREQTRWNRLEDIIEGVKKPFATHGKENIEVWEDEFGTNVSGLDFTYNPHMGEYSCAKYMMRFYIYSGWLNVPTAWWALYNMNKSQDWGIINQQDYSFRPMSFALQNVCSVVSDVEPIQTPDYSYKGLATDPRVIAYKKDGSEKKLVLVWAAETSTDKNRSYLSNLSFKLDSRPEKVTLTDLYWGILQPAAWSYKDGTLTIDGIIVHDYPVVITCQ
jgi:uncharacterized repeat protein (TIGR01451 family)